MMRKHAFVLIVLSVALNIGFAGLWAAQTARSEAVRRFFQCPDGRTTNGDGAVWCPLHRQLAVTDRQWQTIESRMAEFRRITQAVCREINRNRGELIDLIASSEVDRAAITAKQQEILAGQRRMQELVIEHLLAEKEVLTVEQQRELFDMIRRRSGCMGPGLMRGEPQNRD